MCAKQYARNGGTWGGVGGGTGRRNPGLMPPGEERPERMGKENEEQGQAPRRAEAELTGECGEE